jgi:WD40 repeat protein
MLSERINAHSEAVASVAFSPDGSKIVSGSDDKTIKVWELRDQPVGERTFVASQEEPTVIQEAYMNGCTPLSINGITVTSWEELGETFIEAEGEVTIKVWDLGALLPLKSLLLGLN